mgnify:CR=1 FL=1
MKSSFQQQNIVVFLVLLTTDTEEGVTSMKLHVLLSIAMGGTLLLEVQRGLVEGGDGMVLYLIVNVSIREKCHYGQQQLQEHHLLLFIQSA